MQCIVCGIEFSKKRKDQSSCGKTYCRKKAWKIQNRGRVNSWQREYFRKKTRADWIEKVCVECGKSFLPNFRNHKQQTYCSARCRERRFRYSERGIELHNWHSKQRRHRIKAGGGFIVKTEWDAMKTEYLFRCPRCLRSEPEIVLTIDHIVPISLGGEHAIINIQPLCISCNSKKHTRIEFYPVHNVVSYTG